ncbi:MAG: hypothetical protein Harvfovirus9_25 [Harvfovirus sp.]|uniref:Uncharacterized protein n=1 Tax=Harvfovirus sp. TaxID=2487768 RepID=A0A3G5A111_9VIRU|nr:MAG: hypothetical protein Harvfovirus9_25 [Harvfovirus sp.]
MAADPVHRYSYDLDVPVATSVTISSFDNKKLFTLKPSVESPAIESIHEWCAETKFVGRRRQMRVLSNIGNPWVGYTDEKGQFHVVYPYLMEDRKAIGYSGIRRFHFKKILPRDSPFEILCFPDKKEVEDPNFYYEPVLLVLDNTPTKNQDIANIIGIIYPLYDLFAQNGWINELYESDGFMCIDVSNSFSLVSERMYMTMLNYRISEFFKPTEMYVTNPSWLYYASMILFHWITRLGLSNGKLSIWIHIAVNNILQQISMTTGDRYFTVGKYLELRYYQLKTKGNIEAYLKAYLVKSPNPWENLLAISREYGGGKKFPNTYDLKSFNSLLTLYKDIMTHQGIRLDDLHFFDDLDLLVQDYSGSESKQIWKFLILGRITVPLQYQSFIDGLESIANEPFHPSYGRIAELYFIQSIVNGEATMGLSFKRTPEEKGKEAASKKSKKKSKKRSPQSKRLVPVSVSKQEVLLCDKSIVLVREEERKQIIEKKQQAASLGACISCRLDVYAVDDHYYVVSCEYHMSERIALHKQCHTTFNMRCPRERGEIIYVAEFTQLNGKNILLDNRKRYEAIQAVAPPVPAAAAHVKIELPSDSKVEKKDPPPPEKESKKLAPAPAPDYDLTKERYLAPSKSTKTKDAPLPPAKPINPKRFPRTKKSLEEFNEAN